MTEFQRISAKSDIEIYAPQSKGWREASKFNSKDRVIDRYQLIVKRERPYSLPYRVARLCLGLLATVCSFGICLVFSKSVQDLITKDCETIRFGLWIPPKESSSSDSSHATKDPILQIFKLLFVPASWH